MIIHNTYDERSTKIMMAKPITDISRLIGEKWFLGIEKLAERSGVYVNTIKKVLQGEPIGKHSERTLRKFLENYKGELI